MIAETLSCRCVNYRRRGARTTGTEVLCRFHNVVTVETVTDTTRHRTGLTAALPFCIFDSSTTEAESTATERADR